METKEERIKYGLEAEIAVKNYFNDYGVKLIHNIVDAPEGEERKNQIFSNMKNGDLCYRNKERNLFRIDVKRGQMISEKSLRFFRGQFFILVPNGNIDDIENSRVIWRRTVENYVNKATHSWNENYDILPSGEKGYRLINPLKKETTLSDFVNRFIKHIIINPSLEMSKEFYEAFFFGGETNEQV